MFMMVGMERYRTQEGLLVGRKPLPGGDIILFFVTPEGAFQTVARKAQRPSGRSGRLSLFHHLNFQTYHKPGNDLPTLTQVELVGRLEGLEEAARFPYASFLAELAYRLASPEVAARVWPILISGLKGISKHPEPQLVMVWAGWRTVRAAGLAPNLEGQGFSLAHGQRAERGIYLGLEGLQALADILRLPGTEAIELLRQAPLDRLQNALKAHVAEQVGELGSVALLG
jgi:DNA repair protein RecO (recombination protein O)